MWRMDSARNRTPPKPTRPLASEPFSALAIFPAIKSRVGDRAGRKRQRTVRTPKPGGHSCVTIPREASWSARSPLPLFDSPVIGSLFDFSNVHWDHEPAFWSLDL